MATNEENNEDRQQEDLDYEIEVVDDEAPAGGKQKEAGEANDDNQDDDEPGDRRAKSGGENRDGEQADDELTPDQREKREKRRKERQLRKQRQEERDRRLEALEARNAELESRLNQTSQRLVSGDYQRVVAAHNEASSQAAEAKRLMDEAKRAENWGAHADALEAYWEAVGRAQHFGALKQRYEASGANGDGGAQDRGGERNQRRQPDQAIKREASKWRSKNSWFDPNRGDADSKLAAAIDEQVYEDGFDPKTPEYWRELDKRIAKQLPHRARNADDVDDDLDDEPSPTSGSGRERAPSGKRTVKISRERIEALKEAGVDVKDPKAMAPYLRRYAQWDKEHQDELKGR